LKKHPKIYYDNNRRITKHGIKILYVEDELFLGKIVKESLESRRFDVVMEADGSKVLGLFKQERPDICVLDIMLPNKDGFELLRRLGILIKKHLLFF
jgi:DNA-binding response OmpR family regulator